MVKSDLPLQEIYQASHREIYFLKLNWQLEHKKPTHVPKKLCLICFLWFTFALSFSPRYEQNGKEKEIISREKCKFTPKHPGAACEYRRLSSLSFENLFSFAVASSFKFSVPVVWATNQPAAYVVKSFLNKDIKKHRRIDNKRTFYAT